MNIAEQRRYTDVEHAEKSLLANLLDFPENRKKVKLKPEHFSDSRHGEIYRFLKINTEATPADAQAEGIKNPRKYGDFDFIGEVIEYGGTSRHSLNNAQKEVYELFKAREKQRFSQEYHNNPTDENEQKLITGIQELNAFSFEDQNNKMNTLLDIFDDMYNENSNTVIPTGFDKLDSLIGGFESGQLNVIAARPSMGKTALAIQLGMQLSTVTENNQVIFCSLETDEKNVTQRALSHISKVDLSKFKNPFRDMAQNEIDRVMNAMNIYNKMNYTVEDKAVLTPSDVRNIANKNKDAEHCFIIIDYLQLMASEKRHGSKYEEVSHISRELKVITQEAQNVTIIALAQLNRDVEKRQDKRPMMSDLRDSGSIEQDSALMMMLYRDDYYYRDDSVERGTPSDLEIMVVKNKDGPTGTVKVKYYKEVQKIY